MVANVIVITLSVLGIGISFYFGGVYFGVLGSEQKWIPKVCQLKIESCSSLLKSKQAKTFNIPNFILGIFLYTYLIIDQAFFNPWLGFTMLSFAVMRSIYLAYHLICVIKIPCVFCFASHIINTALFAVYISGIII